MNVNNILEIASYVDRNTLLNITFATPYPQVFEYMLNNIKKSETKVPCIVKPTGIFAQIQKMMKPIKKPVTFYEQFHKVASKNHKNSKNVIPLYNRLQLHIVDWETLFLYSKSSLEFMDNNHVCNIKKIAENKLNVNIVTFQENLSEIPILLLCKIWHNMFKYILPDDSEKNDVENYRKYLEELTLYMLVTYRKDVNVNNRFILCCFHQKLTRTLFELLNNAKFYSLNICHSGNFKKKNLNLIDFYLCVAAEYNYIEYFLHSQLVCHVEYEHVLYALKYSSIDFLNALLKSKQVLKFDLIKVLDSVEAKDSKQKLFKSGW
jgi:hypothetical protein